MSDGHIQLLRALRSAILADTSLGGLISGVFDPPVRGVAHPFVSFGTTKATPLDGDEPLTMEHQVEVWVYSRQRGRWEVSHIAESVRNVLNDRPLNLAGHMLVGIRHRDTDIAPVQDRRGFRARLRFRALTTQNT